MVEITPLQTEIGFIPIEVSQVEIVNNTKIVLHLINPAEILELISQMEQNIKTITREDKYELDIEIQTLRSKIGSITPNTRIRQKRGLLNIGGTVQKWLFGVMDDSDRQNILQHLINHQENNHQIINTINQQININDNIQKSINNLKETIIDDREKITNTLNNINTYNNELRNEILYHDQIIKLKFLNDKIDIILDSIASARYKLFHPSILTNEELSKYSIDFYKIKLIKMDVMIHEGNIVIAIKIPIDIITTKIIRIIPITNSNNEKIDAEIEEIININNKTYKFENEKTLRELKLSKNCITENNCKLIKDFKTVVEVINDGTILIQNANKMLIKEKCNEREITHTIENNTLIEFINCTIIIEDEQYSNKQEIYIQKFDEDNMKNNYNFSSTPSFKEIVIREIKNIKEIQELKIRNIISDTSTIAIIIILSITIIYVFLKLRTIQNKYRIQENPMTKGGGVTYLHPNVAINADDDISIIVQKYLKQ